MSVYVKQIKKHTVGTSLILLSLLVIMSSCDEKFEEINTNPNALTEIDPLYLFTNGTIQTLRGSNNSSDR